MAKNNQSKFDKKDERTERNALPWICLMNMHKICAQIINY